MSIIWSDDGLVLLDHATAINSDLSLLPSNPLSTDDLRSSEVRLFLRNELFASQTPHLFSSQTGDSQPSVSVSTHACTSVCTCTLIGALRLHTHFISALVGFSLQIHANRPSFPRTVSGFGVLSR